MAKSVNKVILIGNLGKDPEIKYTPSGTAVAKFSLATNEHRKDRTTGEANDITTWFRVTLWGRQAETASQYLTRGRPVYVEGRLRVEDLHADILEGHLSSALCHTGNISYRLGAKKDPNEIKEVIKADRGMTETFASRFSRPPAIRRFAGNIVAEERDKSRF